MPQVPMLGVIIAYADNVLLLAKTRSERDSMTKALGAALKAHPVGRLRPRKKVFKRGEPIEFLGHLFSIKSGMVQIEPSQARMDEFLTRVSSDLARLQRATLALSKRKRKYRKLKEYIESWTAAFQLCDNIDMLRKQWLSNAGEALKSASGENKPMSKTTCKTFKLHEDQKEIVEAALQNVKEKTGTAVDTVALEFICQQYMGTGIAFADAKQALTAERKKAGSDAKFVAKLIGWVEELAPSVTFQYELKK
jgi:hypothetical protein